MEQRPESLDKIPALTIGICATGTAENLPVLLDIITKETEANFAIKKIVIVASGCHRRSISYVRRIANSDNRVILLEENRRYGKAEAINKIIELREGNFLLFINSDALPKSDAIEALVSHIVTNPYFGIVSARPVIEDGKKISVIRPLEELLWAVHNESSLQLNHLGLSNHANDEMMIVRSDLLETLPDGLVNDGAFIASKIQSTGHYVGFSNDAGVKISVPTRYSDFVAQRRRILFGHFQVWKLLGRTPITVESMFFFSPKLSFSIIAKTLARNPRLIFALPLTAFTECISTVLALADFSRSSKRHGVWARYDN